MAALKVLKGTTPGQMHGLFGDRTIIGRHPNCQIVLDNGAVSRHHAQVLEGHGTYHVEDLRSRNGTTLNGEPVDGRMELNDGDQIRICDMVFVFMLHPSALETGSTPSRGTTQTRDLAGQERPTASMPILDESRVFVLPEDGDEPEFESPSSVLKRIDARTEDGDRVRVQPEVKLKAIIEISRELSSELEIDTVLPKLLEVLFNIFPQAEQGFILLRDQDTDKLHVKATRSRGQGDSDAVAVSMTVVRHAMQTGEAILSANLGDDSRFRKSSLSRLRIHSMLCAPLVQRDGDPLGVIQIVTRDSQREFADEDLDLLVSVAAQAALAIGKAELHEELVKKHELEKDLEFATQVQLGFLPKSKPKIPGYSFADYYEAALRVGGDYFDYVELPGGQVAVVIGDVAGKGMPAALLMARLYSSTRYQFLTKTTASEAMAGLNVEISSSGLGHRFITFLAMIIDPARHEMTIVNAGHLAPLVRSANGEVRMVGREQSSLPLGIIPDQEYNEVVVPLAPGDTVIGYTDGVSEAMNDDRSIYGRERLQKCLTGSRGTVDDAVKAIISDVEAFTGDAASRDDTCIVGFQREAKSAAP